MLSINLGRSVLEKNCALGLEYLKTKGTFFSIWTSPAGD